MTMEQGRTYFSIRQIHKGSELAFRNHPQHAILVDILSRKYNHHAILQTDFSPRMVASFLEALLSHLHGEQTPKHLRIDEFNYVDFEACHPRESGDACNGSSPGIGPRLCGDDRLSETTGSNEKCTLLVIRLATKQSYLLKEKLDSFIHAPHCRLLIISNIEPATNDAYINEHFTRVILEQPSETDITALLKQHRSEMENFHHVIIPEDILAHAYNLAGRYLSTNQVLEKALLLLDSSAARTAASEYKENNPQFKPVVTAAALASVLSGWTQIPASLLQSSKFRLGEFSHGMEQRVFGQDAALSIITHELQQAIVRTQASTGPFCSFLFAGPEHAGKKTTAVALADQMFKHLNTLYFAQLASSQTYSIADVKLQRYQDRHRIPFEEVIQQTPYAVIVFENVDQASPAILDELYEILSTGYFYGNQRGPLNLHQAIIILSTTLGSKKIIELTKTQPREDETNNIDLMQLIMNEQQREQQSSAGLTPHEFALEILPTLTEQLPPLLCKHVHVVPFVPLNKAAAENVIKQKIKYLAQQLKSRYKIELNCATEIAQHLAREATSTSMDKALKQLYFVVEQAVLHQLDNPNRANQLYLQLNETGRLLRCDWISNAAQG